MAKGPYFATSFLSHRFFLFPRYNLLVNPCDIIGLPAFIFLLSYLFWCIWFIFQLLLQKERICKTIDIARRLGSVRILKKPFVYGFWLGDFRIFQYKILPIIQFADITGAYGVSFLLVMVNIMLFGILSNPKDKIIIAFYPDNLCSDCNIAYGFYKLIPKPSSQR